MDSFLNDLEEKRQKITFRIIIDIIISVFVLVVLLIIIGIEKQFAIIALFASFFIFIIIYYCWINAIFKEYKSGFKNNVVKNVLGGIFQDINLDYNACIDKEEIRNTYLVAVGNKYRGDDLMTAKYNGITFRQCDLHIQDVRSTGKTTTTVTYFKGKWMQFEFNKKKLDGYIQIREKEFGGAKKVYGIFSNMPQTEYVKTESIWFNDNFEIRAANPHTAFYLLTPHFMEMIKNLKERVEGQINIAFVNGVLNIAINNNLNSFEPPLFSPISEEISNILKNEANIIIDVIQALKLDEDN
jgi:hypothetical protein